jgi:flagellar hook-associated protein 2
LQNNNTHRDIQLRNVQILDPNVTGGVKPLNAVAEAQDAVVSMDGIEIRRPTTEIDDLLPGVTITARRASDRPVTLNVEPDREAVKDSIIAFVGNYNRLVAEINILTRNDPRVLEELTYLSREEQADFRERLGAFSGDSSLMQMRNTLTRITSVPYPTSLERDLALLTQIGIGTDVRWSSATGGLDASRLRGYLEIDERILDDAIATKLPAIKELFGSDTTGDRIADTGVAVDVDTLTRAFTETGGIFSLRTNGITSSIAQENRRIENLDRQLAQREMDLRRQYGQMEGAFMRMEQMSSSLENFQRQANNNNNR